MVVGTEAAQLDLFCILDLLGVTVAPFHGHFGVGIGVDKHVECAISVQNGEESH